MQKLKPNLVHHFNKYYIGYYAYDKKRLDKPLRKG